MPLKQCQLCGRQVPLTAHHLIPRKLHKRNRYAKRYDKTQLNETIDLCQLCHRGLHRLYDEVTLAEQFSSLYALALDPAIAKHVDWVRKQKALSP